MAVRRKNVENAEPVGEVVEPFLTVDVSSFAIVLNLPDGDAVTLPRRAGRTTISELERALLRRPA